ncbi:MAG: flagellar hook-length control protein FliK, partial [Methyloprofundus sp.]|nr:flagellar hook-length control protein FliK [Methyloprofundus sp.]
KLALEQKITASVLANDKNLRLKLFTPKAVILEFPKTDLAKNTTSITLQVIKPGDQPQFKILPPPSEEESINNALKELLPKEQSNTVMLNQVVKSLAKNENVPDTLKRLAQDILRNLPTKQQLTESTQLKKNFDNSGLFLEAKLAEGKTSHLSTDLKAKITQLVTALQQDTAANGKNASLQELQTKSEGTLARLVLNQLKSLPQGDANKQVWTVELPFVDKQQAKSLQIQIEEENQRSTDDAGSKSWSATVSIMPPNLSTVHCKISYFNNAVHTNFWSEEGETTQVIQGNLDYLSQRLEAAGLTPGNLNARQQNKHTSEFNTPKTTKPLFNAQA